MKKFVSTAMLALAAVALAVPAVATSAHPKRSPKPRPKPLPVLVHAKPDPLVAAGHDPYVAFALSRIVVGRKYRITQLEGPPLQVGLCTSSLTTDWTRALKGGVAFDLQPMRSGKYIDNAGFDPCKGRYVLKVEWRASSTSQPTLRRFSFDYPSFTIKYLPIRPI